MIMRLKFERERGVVSYVTRAINVVLGGAKQNITRGGIPYFELFFVGGVLPYEKCDILTQSPATVRSLLNCTILKLYTAPSTHLGGDEGSHSREDGGSNFNAVQGYPSVVAVGHLRRLPVEAPLEALILAVPYPRCALPGAKQALDTKKWLPQKMVRHEETHDGWGK